MNLRLKNTWLTVLMVAVAGPLVAGSSITLDQCISTALGANPDIKSASARLEAAKAAIKEAASAYYPQVGLSGNWTRTDNPPQAFFMSLNQRRASLQKDFNNPDDTENIRSSVVAQWRLYDGGRRESDRRATTLGVQAAEGARDTVRNDLVYQITRAYYGILQARAFVQVQEEAEKSITEALRVATERHKAGSAMKTDVLNLNVQLSQTHEDLIRAKNALQLGVAALNTAIGRDMLAASDVVNLPSEPPFAPATNVVASRIESRPELHAAESQLAMAQAMATRARREFLPVVNAFGSVDWDRESLHSDAERSYLAGAAVELNIFDGFRNRAGLARAAAGVAEAQAQADKLRNALLLDLTQARLNEQEARERMDVASKSLTGAEEALRITQERYRQGAADITELMAAQVGLTATRTRLTAAHYDSLIAKANVERAGGLLAERWQNKN